MKNQIQQIIFNKAKASVLSFALISASSFAAPYDRFPYPLNAILGNQDNMGSKGAEHCKVVYYDSDGGDDVRLYWVRFEKGYQPKNIGRCEDLPPICNTGDLIMWDRIQDADRTLIPWHDRNGVLMNASKAIADQVINGEDLPESPYLRTVQTQNGGAAAFAFLVGKTVKVYSRDGYGFGNSGWTGQQSTVCGKKEEASHTPFLTEIGNMIVNGAFPIKEALRDTSLMANVINGIQTGNYGIFNIIFNNSTYQKPDYFKTQAKVAFSEHCAFGQFPDESKMCGAPSLIPPEEDPNNQNPPPSPNPNNNPMVLALTDNNAGVRNQHDANQLALTEGNNLPQRLKDEAGTKDNLENSSNTYGHGKGSGGNSGSGSGGTGSSSNSSYGSTGSLPKDPNSGSSNGSNLNGSKNSLDGTGNGLYSAGGAGGGMGGGSKFGGGSDSVSWAGALQGGNSAVNSTMEVGNGGEGGRGLASGANPLGSADPDDYFARIKMDSNIFKIVHDRYRTKEEGFLLRQ